ncbi:GNAT family N-acetyltransferase [Autumnicola musiva]|uniref:GNAT family N-acetyltransferase n=1 Tax=Autumnicola musiva TaxID=3075589 RepID=A0ABU3DA32_9FLAO|nr:GNAT family N-acetyltransferase [Zunongwangia sp. F117]MDT0677808.1 GNAT family N-acetyltransferase [Zunongwangia sp. F117]
MTILAENSFMQLAFNKILKEDLDKVIPFIQKLSREQTSREILRQRLAEMLGQNYECFGVYAEGRIIGTFGLWFMTRCYAGRSCEPDHIFISEEYQNRGIGKRLFDFIYRYAKEKRCETTELNSYVENHRSHKFYMNEGYIIKGYHFLKKL